MNYSIGCFGKLPIFADFVRFNAANDELYVLDQWFQKGIQGAKMKWGGRWEEYFSTIKPWNFIFSTEAEKYFLAGVFVPNGDRSGRKFPFLIFIRVERSEFKIPVSLAPGYFNALWGKMTLLAQEGWQGLEMDEFLDQVRRLDVSFDSNFAAVEQRYRKILMTRTMKTFWTGLLGDFHHPGKYVLDKHLREALTPLAGQSLSRLGFGLKFPLARGTEENFDIPFWFDLMGSFSPAYKGEPVLFWNREEGDGGKSLLVFFNQPLAKSFFYFLKPDLDEDSWFNLISENQEYAKKALDKISPERKALLDQDETTMEEFLIAAGKIS